MEPGGWGRGCACEAKRIAGPVCHLIMEAIFFAKAGNVTRAAKKPHDLSRGVGLTHPVDKLTSLARTVV